MKLVFIAIIVSTFAFAQKQCSLLQQQGKWDESLKCSFNTLNALKHSNGSKYDSAKTEACYNIGNIYFKIPDPTYSKLYFDSALFFARKCKYLSIIGKIYLTRNQLDSVRHLNIKLNNSDLWMAYHLKKCNYRDTSKLSNTKINLDSAYLLYVNSGPLRKFQYHLGSAQFNSYKHNFEIAIHHLKKAESLLTEISDVEANHHYALITYEYFLNNRDYEKALYWLQKQDSLKRIYSDKPKIIALRELEDIRQFKVKNNQLALEKENRIKLITGISVLVLLILILIAFMWWRNLKQKELKELNSHLNSILGVISHDVRSPIVSLTYLLEDDKTKRDTVSLQLKKIINMVDDILQWSALNLNYLKFNPQEIDVQDFFSEWEYYFSQNLVRQNLTLNFEIKSPVIIADIPVLQLITRNLLQNAINYASSNSVINISVYKENENIKICITNQIDNDVLSQPPKHAKGLGLSLVKKIAVKAGIKIETYKTDNNFNALVLF